ncbi:hypothetical protein K9N68_31855 [Kovacikia minuta CCNUW1]|uniref:hypothetical protein n=1 Tax=Kovacikia minuta TaxID=2931930 RepID=UPI001CCEFC83|nr:hypothetical protein [Kovacikia minuta]UBF26077.1 hypothetical protein K9N68_31855 [Kovacikia minuta CCNUW1]
MVSNSEQRTSIEVVAQALEEKGYSVVIEPSPSTIPFELPNYQPDLLATRGDEHLIIEVKSRDFARPLERYKEISEIVSRQKNWRFMLSTIEDRYQDEGTVLTTDIDTKSLAKFISKLELILDTENYDLALPYLWTAYISGMRILGQRQGVPIDAASDKSVLNYMYSLGEISNEEYSNSLQYLKLRNEIVHRLDIKISKEQANEMRLFVIGKLVEWGLLSKDLLTLAHHNTAGS